MTKLQATENTDSLIALLDLVCPWCNFDALLCNFTFDWMNKINMISIKVARFSPHTIIAFIAIEANTKSGVYPVV